VDQVRDALDAAGLQRATICGVSYGGLIAAAFAARHPDRTASLVLVSAIPPSWSPDRRVQFFLRAPRLLTPLFLLSSMRMYREIAAANGGAGRAMPVAIRHAFRVLTHMFSPNRMADRVRLLAAERLQDELAGLTVPTLIVIGESHLDRVVPVQATRDYLRLWPRAHVETIEDTGHLGMVTRPDRFAALVVPFAERADNDAVERRRIG
jgi:pimeloyl-ACP methyl ester carboxylesterase